MWTLAIPFFWVFWLPILALMPSQSIQNSEPFLGFIASLKSLTRRVFLRIILPLAILCTVGFLAACAYSVKQSDDFNSRFPAFTIASAKLILQGKCTFKDFYDGGGWYKATFENWERPVYFTFCGEYTIKGRIYLNARTLATYR